MHENGPSTLYTPRYLLILRAGSGPRGGRPGVPAGYTDGPGGGVTTLGRAWIYWDTEVVAAGGAPGV